MEKEHSEYKDSDPTVDFKKEIKDRDNTIETLTKAIEDSDTSIEKLQKEILRLKDENKDLNKKVEKLEGKLGKKKEKELVNKTGGLDELNKENEKDFEISSLKKQIEDLKAECEKLNNKFISRKNELDESRRECTEYRDKCNSLEAQLNNAKISIDKLQKCDTDTTIDRKNMINTLEYLTKVLLMVYEYVYDENYLGKVEEYEEKLNKIQVYRAHKSSFDNFESFYTEIKDEIFDIRYIVYESLKSLGCINDTNDETPSIKSLSETSGYDKYCEGSDDLVGTIDYFDMLTEKLNKSPHVVKNLKNKSN